MEKIAVVLPYEARRMVMVNDRGECLFSPLVLSHERETLKTKDNVLSRLFLSMTWEEVTEGMVQSPMGLLQGWCRSG